MAWTEVVVERPQGTRLFRYGSERRMTGRPVAVEIMTPSGWRVARNIDAIDQIMKQEGLGQ